MTTIDDIAARHASWEFYENGKLGPCDEKTLRAFQLRMSVYSDERGICAGVMDQLWREIGQLRSDAVELTAALADAEARGVEKAAKWHDERAAMCRNFAATIRRDWLVRAGEHDRHADSIRRALAQSPEDGKQEPQI